jgi:streptogramin lyase
MKPITRRGLHVFLVVVCAGMRLAAANTATIHGMVTDNTGKPIRGAMITASKGDELVARFSRADGRYEITLPSGTYNLNVKAYGFDPKSLMQDAAHTGETNFSLTPRFNLSQLTSAEVEQLLPDNREIRLIASECIRCHALTYPARRAGMSASDWAYFLPRMTDSRHWDNPYSGGEFKGSGSDVTDYKGRLSALSNALEKYFGPSSTTFGPAAAPLTIDKVHHLSVSDDVLNATIHEYNIPTRDVGAHSIMTDDAGNAWFSEIQERGNKIGKFDWQTKKFTEYQLPIPSSRPHTGVIDKDGIVWMPLTARNIPARLVSLDPKTGTITPYAFPGNPTRPHTTALDQDGNVWMSGTGLVEFDVKTKKFKEYKLPIPTGTEYSDNTWQGWHNLPAKPPLPIDQTIYDVKADSKGMIWCSIESVGLLIRLNPKTGEAKRFDPPATVSIKGIDVDKDDNVWFAVFWGSAIGKFDQKTEKFSIYKPPTPYAMPYGISVDQKTGMVWYADVNGNFISRFNPKTEKFDEFPIPSAQASARFPGADSDSGRVWFTEAMTDKIGYIEIGQKSGGGR